MLHLVAVWHSVTVLSVRGPKSAPPPPAPVGCTSEDTCYNTKAWRCVPAPAGVVGAKCTLDYAFNETGQCVCSSEGPHATCAAGQYPPATAGKKQLLVIGDSVSEGYFPSLSANLSASTKWEAFHAPGNCDNVNWGNRCLTGWLASDPMRWDMITINWGLHDLAFPDNEHLEAKTYGKLLAANVALLKKLAPQATLKWVTTTPCPTNPPPTKQGKSCVLIPGRLESDVLKYNAVAASMISHAVDGVCDMHTVINDYCGVGYSTCDIAQCGGPHFPGKGFEMLGAAMTACVLA